MPINLRELYRVRSHTYDPINPTSKLFYKPPEQRIRFNLATVMDNFDPDNMGRVKLQIGTFGNETLTDWVPVARPFAGPEMGTFSIPETKDTVVVAFLSDNIHKPVVLGQIYDKGKNMAPPIAENPENNIKKFKSKSGMEIVLNDKQGEEQIVLRTKDDKMILNLTKAGGVTIKNEEGKVQISCDSFIMESGKDATFKIEKSAKFEAKSIDIKASKGIAVKSSANVVVKGSKIKLKGSSGVTAEMKMIAVKQDMIVGVDNHQVKIPTQSGPQPGPVLPHPFVGDLKDKLSKDVFVNNKAAATKGSKGKTKVHMPMPPGIMFNKQPDKIGIVDKGCIDSVKINGKAAAVLMAECKTCNDPGPTAMMPAKVLAFGTAISFPANMLGLEASKYATSKGNVQVNSRDMMAGSGAGGGDRQLSNAQWNSSAISVGSEVTLSATINSYPNATVQFGVWKHDANMQNDQPVARLKATSQSSKAETKWRFVPDQMTTDFTDNVASIDSTIGLQRRLKRLNYQVGPIDGIYGPKTKAAVIKFQKDVSIADDGIVGPITKGKLQKKYAEYLKQKREAGAIDNLKFIFTADSHGCTQIKSGEISVGTKIKVTYKFFDTNGNLLKEYLQGDKLTVTTPDAKERSVEISEAPIEIENIPPGSVVFKYNTEEQPKDNNTKKDDKPNNTKANNDDTVTKVLKDTKTDIKDDKKDEEKEDPIKIELLDAEGKPMANETYTIVAPDGSVLAQGSLDENGKAEVTGITEKDYIIRFPGVESKGKLVGEDE